MLSLLRENCRSNESIDSVTMGSSGSAIQPPIGILKQIFGEVIVELRPWVKKCLKRQDDG